MHQLYLLESRYWRRNRQGDLDPSSDRRRNLNSSNRCVFCRLGVDGLYIQVFYQPAKPELVTLGALDQIPKHTTLRQIDLWRKNARLPSASPHVRSSSRPTRSIWTCRLVLEVLQLPTILDWLTPSSQMASKTWKLNVNTSGRCFRPWAWLMEK